MEKNIVLCGFMGCGKTTVGQLLANRLKMRFVDTDAVVEEKAGLTIPEIFARFGEGGFRDREHEAIVELSGKRNLVISTGGGAMTFARNLPPLRESGVVLYLDPGFDECYRRIRQSDRPLVQANDRLQLEEMYQKRAIHYGQAAHHRLAVDGPPDAWADAAVKLLRME